LSRDFNGLRAVDELTLRVPAGSIFGFLGPNGAGKTTTIRLLLGLLEPSSGSAEVLGHDTRSGLTDPRRAGRCWSTGQASD
jgi:ABC-2 type transport system ATP-binding protein